MLLIIALKGCWGGAGSGAFGTAIGIGGNGSLPTVAPALFTAGSFKLPSVLLTFTSELRATAITPDGSKLYAVDTLHKSITVFDLSNGEVLAIIDAGGQPNNIAITPDGTKAFVVNANDIVSVIDTSSQVVIATMSVGGSPFGIAITPDGNRAYVTNRNEDTVSVIDVPLNQVIDAIAVGSRPIAITITPDGTHAYIANYNSNTLSLIDIATHLVTEIIKSDENLVQPNQPLFPSNLAITPDGAKVYVSNAGSNTISVIDTQSHTETVLTVGIGPAAIVMSTDGTRAYVANPDLRAAECGPMQNTLSVIDIETDTVLIKELTVGDAPLGVVITGDGDKVYAYSACSNAISVLDTASVPDDIPNAIKTITINSQARSTGIQIAPDNSEIYVAHPNSLSIIDIPTDNLVDSIPARGGGPVELALTPDGNTLLATNSGSNSISVINALTDQHIVTLQAGSRPGAIVTTNDSTKAYVLNSGFSRLPDQTVTVVDTVNHTVSTIDLDDPNTPQNEGIGPIKLAITPNGAEVLVAHFGNYFPTTSGKRNGVSVINSATDSIEFRLSGPIASSDIQVTPDSSKAVVTGIRQGGISIIDLNTHTSTGGFKNTLYPVSIAINSDNLNPNAFIVDVNESQAEFNAFKWDLDPNSSASPVTVPGPNPAKIAITPDNAKVYILNSGDRGFRCDDGSGGPFPPCDIGNSVSVIDANTNTLITSVTVGTRPTDLAITPDGSKVYVTNYFSNNITVISTANDSILNTIPVGSAPVGIIISPTQSKAYVANSVSKTISVINTNSDAWMYNINVHPEI